MPASGWRNKRGNIRKNAEKRGIPEGFRAYPHFPLWFPRLFLQPDAGIDGGDVPRVVAVWEQTVFLRFYQKQLDIGHPY